MMPNWFLELGRVGAIMLTGMAVSLIGGLVAGLTWSNTAGAILSLSSWLWLGMIPWVGAKGDITSIPIWDHGDLAQLEAKHPRGEIWLRERRDGNRWEWGVWWPEYKNWSSEKGPYLSEGPYGYARTREKAEAKAGRTLRRLLRKQDAADAERYEERIAVLDESLETV